MCKGRVITVQADVADEVAVSAVFDAAVETFGGVDVVVHARYCAPTAAASNSSSRTPLL
jgi:NAD(P)-dependent dehydrogenase (short-subunit alcohol dehydrogenase family)